VRLTLQCSCARCARQLHVLHVAAPSQKKNLVPATLRPEQLESGVNDRNISLKLPVSFLSRDREPGSKAGQKVRCAASTISQLPVAFRLLTKCTVG
jgi:hypothetical protein